MVALPPARAVISPSPLIVATEVFELLQLIVLFVALSGLIVATSFILSPLFKLISSSLRLIPSTAT